MGILERIKNRLPIVGGTSDAPARPAASYRSSPPKQETTPRPPPPAPKTAEQVRTEIEADVAANPVIVFMKGSAATPQCGFSAQAASIFTKLGVPFETRNVLADPALRQGIKDFTDWPTIPQVFVGGEFIGGSDIVKEMYENGELKTAVEEALQAP